MKRFQLLILLLLTHFFITNSYSQLKVCISLTNPDIDSGLFKYDVNAVVRPGQTWRVGSCNIRIYYFTNIANVLTLHNEVTTFCNMQVTRTSILSGQAGVPKTTSLKLIVFDILGKEINELVNSELKPGSFEAEWNGDKYASGINYYKIESEYFTVTKKMLLLK